MDKKKSKNASSSKKAWDEKAVSNATVETTVVVKESEKPVENNTEKVSVVKESDNETENESENNNSDSDNKDESGSDGSDGSDGEDEGDEDSDFEYVEVDKIIQLLQLAFFHPETGDNLCQTFTRVAESIDKNTKTVAKLLQHYESKEQRRKSKSQ